jgi:alanine racemase
MLYGVSPLSGSTTARDHGLLPVMHFRTEIIAISQYPAGEKIGYGGDWVAKRPSIIGVVAAGYGDGYPRHIAENTPVWINGYRAPIVGRVSMDMLTVDLTDLPSVGRGDQVELWGEYIPIETIAKAAGTSSYELLCQFIPRAKLV